jgi:aldehyde:ferredoxin oxidoreductase
VKKVAIACIAVDLHSFAGRCGFGAVLSSKGLKAIVVKGTKNISLSEETKIKELSRKWFKSIGKMAKDTYKAHGTANDIVFCENAGDLPIKYWSQSAWPEGAKKIGAPNYTRVLKSKSWSYPYCPIGCHRHIEFKYEGKIIKGAGPEYESLGMIGSNYLVDDLISISKANDLCNRLGIDTILAGSYVGFTMECFERGLISIQDLNGKEANWGDGDFLVELIGNIGKKEGFGAIFSEGIKQAAIIIGNGAEELIVEIKILIFRLTILGHISVLQ